MLFYIFIIVFVSFSILFNKISAKQNSLSDDKLTIKIAFLRNITEYLWAFFIKLFSQIDSKIDRFLFKFIASNNIICSLFNNIDSILTNTSCLPSQNHLDCLQTEINTLTEQLYQKYIYSWHNKVDLKTKEPIKENDFKINIQHYLKDIIINFYSHIKTKIHIDEILVQFSYYLKKISLGDIQKKNKISLESQVQCLLNYLDKIAPAIVPEEIIELVLNCNCCYTHRDDERKCLEQSDNCVRLFVYNLIIHGLLIPIIDQISSPHYLLYQLIHAISFLDEYLSFEDIFKNLKLYPSSSFEAENIENTINKFETQSFENLNDLVVEAIEDLSRDSIFFDIKIVNVKITNNPRQSSQFVDYIVVFNVLEFDDSNLLLSTKNNNRNEQIPLISKTYQIKRRFREFLDLQHKLEKSDLLKDEFAKIKNKPSNIQHNSETILDRFRLKRITEDSSIVQFRKQYLEAFLTNLSNCLSINESNIFCDFLGYNYFKIRNVQNFIRSENDLESRQSSTTVERGIDKVMSFFKFFLPLQTKVGHLTTQIDDVVVDESVSKKYSITNIEMKNNLADEMLFKIKLDLWFEKYSRKRKYISKKNFSFPKMSTPRKITFKDSIYSLLNAIFKFDSSTILYYISCKIDLCFDIVQLVYHSIWNADRIWIYLFHRLHNCLENKPVIIENERMTLEEFQLLTECFTFEEIFDRLCNFYRYQLSRRTQRRFRLRFALAFCSLFNNSTYILTNIRDLFSSHENNKYSCYLLIDLFIKQFVK